MRAADLLHDLPQRGQSLAL